MKCRINKKVITYLIVSFGLSGCNDQIPFSIENGSSPALELDASYPTSTRASDAGFEDGDRMGIYVMDCISGETQNISDPEINASNIDFTFHGENNKWKGSRDVYWRDNTTPADIVAYYPYSGEIESPEEMSFAVSRRQDVESSSVAMGGYESSDLLWGSSRKQMPTAGAVSLTLNHLMAGIRITLAEGEGFTSGEWSELSKDVIVSNVILSGQVNLSDGSVIVGNSVPESIVPLEINGDYRAVVYPQTIAAGKALISLNVGSDGYNLVKDNAFDFTSGKMHTFTIKVDKRADGKLSFSLSDEGIIKWIDDVEFRDGVMRSYTVIDVPERGLLRERIKTLGINHKDLTNLKLTGEINEEDFQFMREEMISLKALNLKDVIVYDGDRENVIPERAMYKKITLTRIVFPSSLKIIGSDAFHATGLMGDLIIPEGVEKIGERFEDYQAFYVSDASNGDWGAFSYCQNLLGNLELPSTLTHIEHGAFNYDEFEGNLILPSSLELVGAYAFNRNNFTGELSLPQGLKYIGNGAFAHTRFTGSLEIPAGMTVIKQNAFANISFSGSLILPEGIREIQQHAFDGSTLRGELVLPSSVESLGNYAFSNTCINNIIFPSGLLSIGTGCFKNCYNLSGPLVIPERVTRINEYTFAGNVLLSEVVLHENVIFVGGAAFDGSYNLKEITVTNPTPPMTSTVMEYNDGFIDDNPVSSVEKDPFYGIALGNVTLKVPEEAREAYAREAVWKNIGRHVVANGFGCRPEKISALNNTLRQTVIVDGNGEWEISHMPSWCVASVSTGSNKTEVILTVSELGKGSGNREDYVEFCLKGSDVTARCAISQYDYEYTENQCITLQKASVGNGIDLLFVGEGFDAEAIASGEYLRMVNEQMESFFGLEPYTTYRNRFNVYSCISLSQEVGVSTSNTRKDTKFGIRYDNGTGCAIKGLACGNPEEVFDYAVANSPLTVEKMNHSLIIMTLNSDQYGSVTTLTENGSAIAVVGRSSEPYPMDSRGMLQHEACGHAFGKLAEERITENNFIDQSAREKINAGFERGWYANISLNGKMNDVSWSSFIFDTRYSNSVDVFEGGFGFTRGVYRAEINSCMNYGIPYFSAPARMDIMRRILDYSGEGFTMERFYDTDSDKWGGTTGTRGGIPEISNTYHSSGIHHPVKIVKLNKY